MSNVTGRNPRCEAFGNRFLRANISDAICRFMHGLGSRKKALRIAIPRRAATWMGRVMSNLVTCEPAHPCRSMAPNREPDVLWEDREGILGGALRGRR